MPVIKCFQKDKLSIFWSSSTCRGDNSGRLWWMYQMYQRQFLDNMQNDFAVINISPLYVIWMKRSSSGVSFVLPVRSLEVSSQLSLHETIVYSVSNCFMNIKMKSTIINVETSFRHANHSAAFVCGRLLRFNIPKFHHIPITCRCLLSSYHETSLNRRLISIPR